MKEGKRSTGKSKLRNRSAAGARLVTIGKPVLWLLGICKVLKDTTWLGSLGFVTRITGALIVLLWGTLVLRYIDIVDITVGTIKNGVVDEAYREFWLLIVVARRGVTED